MISVFFSVPRRRLNRTDGQRRKRTALAVAAAGAFCLLPWGKSLAGQINVRSAPSAWVHHSWKTEEGLPQNWVECLAQTRDGYLWAGTRAGLARFDGKRFVVFTQANTPALRLDAPKVLHEDLEGNLWIGTKDGLVRHRDGIFRRFSKADGLCHDEITAIIDAPEGGLWIGTGGGVNHYARGRFRSFVNELDNVRVVNALHQGAGGKVWAGFLSGLYELRVETGKFYPAWSTRGRLPREDYDQVLCIYEEKSGDVWFGTYCGIYRLRSGTVERFQLDGANENGEIRAIQSEADGSLWVLHANGLSYFENGGFLSSPLNAVFEGDWLRAVAIDSERNLWLGAAFGGLNRLRPRAITTLTTRDGLSHNDVWSVAPSQRGTMWVGTSLSINEIVEGRAEPCPIRSEDYSPAAMRSVIEDTFGNLWLGTAFFDAWHAQKVNGRWLRAPFQAFGPGGQTRVVYEDRDKNVWVGTKGSLARAIPAAEIYEEKDVYLTNTHAQSWLYKPDEIIYASTNYHWTFEYKDGFWRDHLRGVIFHAPPHICTGPPLDEKELAEASWVTNQISGRLASYDVRAIWQTRTGDHWFGTTAGLTRLRNRAFTNMGKREGLVDERVCAFYEDAEGALWIGTENGLSRLKEGRWSSMTTREGLHEDIIHQILEDDFGNLWMSGKRGIARVSLAALNAVADGTASSVTAVSYGEGDGMLASETNGRVQPAGCKDRQGRLWFPTVRGLVMIDPRLIEQNEIPPEVLIEEARVNDSLVWRDGRPIEAKEEGATQPLELPAGSGRLVEIQYTATSLSAPEKVFFRYRLEGHSPEWREARDRRTAYFTNLRPGHYRFQVTACNNHNVWNNAGASLTFAIAPFYYETLWFRASCLSGAGLLLYVFYRRRLRTIRTIEQLKRENSLGAERDRIRRDLHDEVGAQVEQMHLLAELVLRETPLQNGAQVSLNRAASISKEISRSLDRIVWTMNSENDTLRSFLVRAREYAADFGGAAGLKVVWKCPDEIPNAVITSEERHNLFLILKEAVRNAAEHAGASELTLTAAIRDETLLLHIADDGLGFTPTDPNHKTRGNGLANMRQRAEQLRAGFFIRSAPDQGAEVTVQFPLKRRGRGDDER